jgi:hypothetical protein
MRDTFKAVAGIFVLTLVAATQDNIPKPTTSGEPLTADQVAIYRAVLEDYTKGSNGPLNVANRTEPLEQSGVGFDKACFTGMELKASETSVPTLHKLDPAVLADKRFTLVDPELQEDKIKEHDPQKLAQSVIDDHQQVTDKQLDKAVKQAFETGLFTLSEIFFDKQHRHAIVAYSFVCGELCGNGDLLALAKVGNKWKVIKKCGGWVS